MFAEGMGWQDHDAGTVVPPPRCEGPISLRHVLQHRAQGEPGSMFLYNPIVFGRLSNWVEENTDRTWREWLYEYVIGPAHRDGSPASYAYGWYVQDWQGHRLVWHGGWWPDEYAGLLLKAPDDGWTLVALGNTDGIHWGKPLNEAAVEQSPLAARFLSLFFIRTFVGETIVPSTWAGLALIISSLAVQQWLRPRRTR